MRKEYVELECSVIHFDNEDVVTTSGAQKTLLQRDAVTTDSSADVGSDWFGF